MDKLDKTQPSQPWLWIDQGKEVCVCVRLSLKNSARDLSPKNLSLSPHPKS